MIISSLNNPKIIELAKLKQKKYRDQNNLFLIEGWKIIDQAIKKKLVIEIYSSDLNFKSNDVKVIYVKQNVLNKLSTVASGDLKQIALCKKMNFNEDLMSKVVALDNIQNPNNLGSIIRNAIAFNFDTIIVQGADIYNEKVIRSSKGAIFNINIINVNDLSTFLSKIKNNFFILGTDLKKESIELEKLKLKDKKNIIIVFGNEGHGISKEVSRLIDQNIYIKINFESLNIAVANAIILYFLKD
ncbi:TrmH family RNA methyltransferase [Mesomycoplasma neurolyticum]|uniref:tRNA/rRNA methyltransferase n=1 Tax=Mesomycoplasma neurolyticum TaxID=2120 RepID=A0A449A4G0_9BACT|nr:RNA methyltransferase [Mesomycoplasma neurolyticum]VEU59127.1 tRNA/rRNA methyltransferase [Mesomycoplasma neurolyticum]